MFWYWFKIVFMLLMAAMTVFCFIFAFDIIPTGKGIINGLCGIGGALGIVGYFAAASDKRYGLDEDEDDE